MNFYLFLDLVRLKERRLERVYYTTCIYTHKILHFHELSIIDAFKRIRIVTILIYTNQRIDLGFCSIEYTNNE